MSSSFVKPSWLLARLGPTRPRGCTDTLTPLLTAPLLVHLASIWEAGLADPPLPFALVKQRVLLSLLTLRTPWAEGVEAAARDLVSEALRCACAAEGGATDGGAMGSSAGGGARRLQLLGAALVLALRPSLRCIERGGAAEARELEAAECLAASVAAVAAGARARLATARSGGASSSAPNGRGGGSLFSAPPSAYHTPAVPTAPSLTAALRLCSITGARGMGGGARSVHPSLNPWVSGLVWSSLPLEARLGSATAALRGALRCYGAPGGPAAFAAEGSAAASFPALGDAFAAEAATAPLPPSRDFFLAASAHGAQGARDLLLSRAAAATVALDTAQREEEAGAAEGSDNAGTAAASRTAAAEAHLDTSLSALAAFLRPGLEVELAAADAAARVSGAASGMLWRSSSGAGGGGAPSAPKPSERVQKRPREAALLDDDEEEREEEGGGRGGAKRSDSGQPRPSPAAPAAGAQPDRLLSLLNDAPLLNDAMRAIITSFAEGKNKLEFHPSYSAAAAAEAAAVAGRAAAAAAAEAATATAPAEGASSLPPASKYPGLPSGVSPKLKFELRQEVANLGVGGIGGGGGGGGETRVMQVFLELDFAESKWRCFQKKRAPPPTKK